MAIGSAGGRRPDKTGMGEVGTNFMAFTCYLCRGRAHGSRAACRYFSPLPHVGGGRRQWLVHEDLTSSLANLETAEHRPGSPYDESLHRRCGGVNGLRDPW